MSKKSIFTYTPRILVILYTIFLSMFALDTPIGIGLFIHLIPSFILLAILALAWKKPILGGLYVLIGIIFTLLFHSYRELPVFILVTVIPVVIGSLFLLSHKLNK